MHNLTWGASMICRRKPAMLTCKSNRKPTRWQRQDKTKAQVYYWEALTLEEIGDPLSIEGARNAWYELIALPADAMPAEWRSQAFDHLKITPTFTPSLTPTITPTVTLTPSATSTSILHTQPIDNTHAHSYSTLSLPHLHPGSDRSVSNYLLPVFPART